MKKMTLADIAHYEAVHLVRALEANTCNLKISQSMVLAANALDEDGDNGPAAVVLDALYRIAGRSQDDISMIIACGCVETFVTALIASLKRVLEDELSYASEDEACSCSECSECGLMTLRDVHVPAQDFEEEDEGEDGECFCSDCVRERRIEVEDELADAIALVTGLGYLVADRRQ